MLFSISYNIIAIIFFDRGKILRFSKTKLAKEEYFDAKRLSEFEILMLII